MAADERSTLGLLHRLEEVGGEEHTVTLMELLPPTSRIEERMDTLSAQMVTMTRTFVLGTISAVAAVAAISFAG